MNNELSINDKTTIMIMFALVEAEFGLTSEQRRIRAKIDDMR